MKTVRLILGVVLVCAGVGAAVWYVLPGEQKAAPRPGQLLAQFGMAVGVATATPGDMAIVLNALGTVVPSQTVAVKSQITGQLIRVVFEEGQTVAAGDLLAEVDPRPYQAALDQVLGQLQRDEAQLRNAQTDAARYRRLVAQDSIARQQLDTQEALVRQYEGTIQVDKALVETARLNLAYTRILAPIGGRVGLRGVDAGNFVQMNDASAIAVITQVRPIAVLFSLPEDAVPDIRRRLATGAALAVTVLDRGQARELATGVLAAIDNQIDPATGTLKLRGRFANEDERLFPNQFVNVRLVVDTVKNAIIVPMAAIQRGRPGTFVYAVKADDTVQVRPVKLGATDGDRVVVETGLEKGERVVVDGADRLRDGARIRIPRAPDGGATPRPAGREPGAAPTTGRQPRAAADAPANTSGGPPGERQPAIGAGPGTAPGGRQQ